MRFSDDTRFPHPVLGHLTGDFLSGEFSVSFQVDEDPATGALTLKHKISLTEPAIRELVINNRAAVGCFIRCNDTYYTDLRRLAWQAGRSDFPAGTLLNRVLLRPVVWLTDRLDDWNPGTIHSEFQPPISLNKGDIVAVGDESIISVGLAKLTPIESIFKLDRSPEVPEGEIRVELDCDHITILVASKTHETISLLRQQATGLPVVMNAVYLPAVMEVLDILRDPQNSYEARRWYQPFIAKCDAKGIDPKAEKSILENAQRLLERPARALEHLLKGEE